MVHEEGKSGRGCRQDGVALRSEKDDMERLRYLAGRTPTRPAPPSHPPSHPPARCVALWAYVARRMLHVVRCTMHAARCKNAAHPTRRSAQRKQTQQQRFQLPLQPTTASASVMDVARMGVRSVWHKRYRVRTLYKRDRSVWHKRDRVRTLSDLASSRGRTRWCIRSICGSRTQ
jgi:hypothetical protein